jgi:hypothetical protein
VKLAPADRGTDPRGVVAWRESPSVLFIGHCDAKDESTLRIVPAVMVVLANWGRIVGREARWSEVWGTFSRDAQRSALCQTRSAARRG